MLSPNFTWWQAWFTLALIAFGAAVSSPGILAFLPVWLVYVLPIVIKRWPSED